MVGKVGESYSCCSNLWSPRALLHHADAQHGGGVLLGDPLLLEAAMEVMVEEGLAEKTDGKYSLTEAGMKNGAALAAEARALLEGR